MVLTLVVDMVFEDTNVLTIQVKFPISLLNFVINVLLNAHENFQIRHNNLLNKVYKIQGIFTNVEIILLIEINLLNNAAIKIETLMKPYKRDSYFYIEFIPLFRIG